MANLLSLAPELLLNICEYLVLIEAEEPRKDVESRERRRHMVDLPAGPCHTAYRTLSVMARTCRTLRPIAMDSFKKHAVWLFNRPIAAFTQQTVPDKTRHIEILRDDIASDPPRYRGRTRDDIAQDVSQVWERSPEDTQETITKDPAQVELALFISKASETRTLAMKTGHVHADISDKRGYGESPVWLLPIVDAMEESKTDRYSKLHTIEVDMQSRYSSDVAHLLKLPGLRKLALASLSCNDEVVEPLNWPVETSSSAVKTLILHNSNVADDFLVHMVASCHALSQV